MLRGPLQTLQGGRCSLGSVLQASLPAWHRQVQENSGVAWSCLCSVVLFRCHLVYKCACCGLPPPPLADSCLQHVAPEDNWASFALQLTVQKLWWCKAFLCIWNNDCRTGCLHFPAFYLQRWRMFFNICRALPAHKDALKHSNSVLNAIFIGQNLESTWSPFLSPRVEMFPHASRCSHQFPEGKTKELCQWLCDFRSHWTTSSHFIVTSAWVTNISAP